MKKKTKMRVRALISAAAVGVFGAVIAAVPASAASAVYADLANTPSTQLVQKNLTFQDSRNNTFEVRVKTTWQRLSSSKATLRTVVVEPVKMPRGDCLQLTMGSNGLGVSGNPKTLCPTGYVTWAPSKTVTARTGTTLGQLYFTTPDPWAPFSGGVRTITIQYTT
ncbi:MULTISPECIES: hypothetical protein [Microbacterium]|uniref:hypothetical protein n=1 Tax=Microbacterium TaxID=33882 RepID=UPI0011EA9195|nr:MULTISPECIES: hypothetical protein [Microbacterium]